MRISVVTVCYNAVSLIEATMLSVFNQTYRDVEYIVIDGGSTDGTIDIIRKYSDRLAYWVSEPDRGIYDAMNKGIAAATGDYINFMNAGDSFAAIDIVQRAADVAMTGDYGVIYGDAIVFEGDFSYISKASPLANMKRHGCICHQAAFIRNEKDKLYYDREFRIAADYDMFMRYYYEYSMKFHYLGTPVCNYSLNGVSDGNIKAIKEFRKASRRYFNSVGDRLTYAADLAVFRIKSALKKMMGKSAVAKVRKGIHNKDR